MFFDWMVLCGARNGSSMASLWSSFKYLYKSVDGYIIDSADSNLFKWCDLHVLAVAGGCAVFSEQKTLRSGRTQICEVWQRHLCVIKTLTCLSGRLMRWRLAWDAVVWLCWMESWKPQTGSREAQVFSGHRGGCFRLL